MMANHGPNRKTYLTILILAGVISFTSAAEKSGWWIRVNTGKTETSSISFQKGTSNKDRSEWMTWHSGESNEFDLPIGYRTPSELYIQGSSNPNDKNAWFCVYYQDKPVKHFDFDNNEDHQMGQGDRDEECK